MSGVLVIAATLRAPITIVGPLVDLVRQHFGLGAAQTGMLAALPLLAFAAMSPLVGQFARQYGLERSLFGGMVILATGVVLRSTGPQWALFAGTWLIGSGIAVGNVLLPSLVKRDFAAQVTRITAAYMLVMALASALSSTVAIPIADLGDNGWHIALGSVVLLPLLAMVLWLPQLSGSRPPASNTHTALLPRGAGTWHSPLAWQISIFMGLTSFLYYTTVGWLSSVLVAAGFSPHTAGSLQGALHLASASTSLVMVLLGRRLKDQRWAALTSALLTSCGFTGLAMSPLYAAVWICLLGCGFGLGIILGLSFLSLRASSSAQVATLSGMAQGVGYLLGAVGPPVLGVLHEAQGGWSLPLLESATLALVMGCAGWLAGRDLQIDAALPQARSPRAASVATSADRVATRPPQSAVTISASPPPDTQFASFCAEPWSSNN